MPVSTRGRHLMMMMVVLMILVMMLVMMLMVMLMVLLALTMSGIKLRPELGHRWRNQERLASHQGCWSWRQSCRGIGMGMARLGPSSAGGCGGGGGGGLGDVPPVFAAGGSAGLGVALPQSVPLLSLGRQQSGCSGRRSGHGGRGPIPFWFVLACCLQARSARRPGVLARVRLPVLVPAGVGGWGVGAGPAPASLPGTAVLPGGGGITATASGGGRGPTSQRLAGLLEGWADWGGLRRGSPPPSPEGAACSPLLSPPLIAGASLPGVCVRLGPWSTSGAECGLPPAGEPGRG